MTAGEASGAVERRAGGDVLTIALGTTVVTWTLLYIAAVPPGHQAVWVVAAIGIAACLLGSGYVAGRFAGRTWAGGAGVGALVAAIGLLVLLSFPASRSGEALVPALLWILGFLGAAVVLGAAGAAVGGRRTALPAMNWTALLAWVAAITTLLMLIAGGIVTGLEAGLAVEGWIIPEGHLLVLFPISLMQRDVATFVEHAHRLWGLLVGLTAIVLMAHLWLADRRSWIRWLSAGVVLAVIVQGVMGGTRVTEQSVTLAVAHGVFAHAVFAAVVLLAVANMSSWVSAGGPRSSASAATDRTLGIVLLAAIVLQIVLGTLFRHLQPEPGVPRGALMGVLHGHSFVGSALVLVLVILCGVRAMGLYGVQRPVRRSGLALVHTLILQVLLGIGSFVVVPKGPREAGADIPVHEVVFTTAHQATGAILLAAAVALCAWQRRLLTPAT